MERRDLCTNCRKETGYFFRKWDVVRTVRNKQYTFRLTEAVCEECGKGMNNPGMIDLNIQEMDEQYRAAEGIVSVEDIENLMDIYRIGKAPLSLALGLGEITVTRYLEGQVPSKEYSDIIKKALSSPEYMKEMLTENKSRLKRVAYDKAMAATEDAENLLSVPEKLLQMTSYIFREMDEVTPLALQKLLYFIQGIYTALYGRTLYDEECQAWEHGPVYPEIYNMLRGFLFDPLDDPRFSLIKGKADYLEKEERYAADLVLHTFGMYSGKALEKIACSEVPWKETWIGTGPAYAAAIPNGRITGYYTVVKNQYNIQTEQGLNAYIADMLA